MLQGYDMVLYLIANMFRIYTLSKFMNLFFRESKCTKRQEVLIFVLYYLINSITFIFLKLPTVNLIINLVILFCISLLYRGGLQTKILATLMIYVFNMLIEACTSEFLLVVYTGPNMIFLALTISSMLLYSFELVLEKLFVQRSNRTMHWIHWMAIILTPIISMFIGTVVILSSVSRLLATGVVTTLFIMNVVVFYLFDYLGKHYAAEYDKIILKEQNAAYLNQMRIMNESQTRLRGFKHDMKNHMFNMSRLASQGARESLLDYISETLDYIEVPGAYVLSGNDYIDSILNFKIAEAKGFGGQVETQIQVPETLQIEAFYLNMILCNLLDNAIEAIKQCANKWIHIRIELDKGGLYITVSNSYEGQLIRDGNRFITTKQDASVHGIGLRNVELSVEKCRGTMNISGEDGIFTVDVMLFDQSVEVES